MSTAGAVKKSFTAVEDRRGGAVMGSDSTMMVSIRSYDGRVPRGTFISLHSAQTYEFEGLDQMLLMMEDIMDAVSMPWPFFGHRSLYEDGEPYVFCETGCGDSEAEEEERTKDLCGARGASGLSGADAVRTPEMRLCRASGAGLRHGLECIPQLPRGRASFVLRVCCRQHGSMQGELLVTVRRKQKKTAFRSALELVRLLYEYLDTELGGSRG